MTAHLSSLCQGVEVLLMKKTKGSALMPNLEVFH